jgi:glucose-1-phosphate thymidylyltransferase
MIDRKKDVTVSETLKIIVPMAGLGSRLRPHTLTRPRPLLPMAGKTVLDYFLDSFTSIPLTRQVEYVFIVGQMGEQIQEYIEKNYPQLPAQYVIQSEMRGQSDAIYLAQEHMTGPAIVAFSDTLVDTDFTTLISTTAEAVVWVKQVEDPRRFGVAEVNTAGYVNKLIEKPQDLSNNLALVGIYYFKDSRKLCNAIEEQVKRDIKLRNEYYLADAVNLLLENGMKMRARPVDVWLDAGTPDAMLSTNRYLLDNGNDNTSDIPLHEDVLIVPPVYIHPEAEISSSVIGPNVSIGAGCKISACILSNVIMDEGAEIDHLVIDNSLLGKKVRVHGRASQLSLGDQTQVDL